MRCWQKPNDQLDSYGVFSTTPLPLQVSNQFLEGEIAGLGATAAVIPVIFLLVAALVLNVLITRLTRQQRTVIGTLKALGYTDWQVFAHFLKFGLSVGIVGGVLGSILGYLSATGMTVMYRQFFEFPDLRSGFYLVHAHGRHGGQSVVRRAGQPAWSAGHAAASAGRGDAARTAARGAPDLARAVGPWWSKLSSAWRMTLRGLFRHRLRTLGGDVCRGHGGRAADDRLHDDGDPELSDRFSVSRNHAQRYRSGV